MSAPKPANWQELVDAWSDPDRFARLAAEYRLQIAAQRAADAVDITEPRRRSES